MKLRWKKHKRPTGLARIGFGEVGSDLWDGVKTYATVYKLKNHRDATGWYFAGMGVNTCNEPSPDEASAKTAAMAHVRAALAKAEGA